MEKRFVNIADAMENTVCTAKMNAVNTIEIDTINATCKVNVESQTNICCPHCGESYYMEKYSTSTCMYFPPIYKDGVNINPDRNISTTYCTCMNCGKDFSF